MMGYSLGEITGPQLLQVLIASFSWRGALLIFGALMAQRAPIGMTFWHPESPKLPQHEDKTSNERDANGKKLKHENIFLSLIKKSFDFSMFKYLPFLFFCLASMLQKFYAISFFNFLPSFAVEEGFSLEQAAFMLSISPVSSMSFRAFIVFIANMKSVDVKYLYSFGIVMGSVAVVVLLTAGKSSFGGIIGSAMCNGMHLGECSGLLKFMYCK